MQNAPFGGGAIAPAHCETALAESQTATGFAGGTRIMTLEGLIPIDCLCPGDRIITRDTGMARLRAVRSRVHADLCPVVVSAAGQGHFRPEMDVTLGAGTALLLRDWRARVLYGREVAMVPARRLIDGCSIRNGAAQVRMRLFTLELDAAHVIYAEGVCAAAG